MAAITFFVSIICFVVGIWWLQDINNTLYINARDNTPYCDSRGGVKDVRAHNGGLWIVVCDDGSVTAPGERGE